MNLILGSYQYICINTSKKRALLSRFVFTQNIIKMSWATHFVTSQSHPRLASLAEIVPAFLVPAFYIGKFKTKPFYTLSGRFED